MRQAVKLDTISAEGDASEKKTLQVQFHSLIPTFFFKNQFNRFHLYIILLNFCAGEENSKVC